MKINIIFSAGFSELLGRKSVEIDMDKESVTVKEVVDELFRSQREFYNRIVGQKLYYTDRLNAVYVVDNKVVQRDFIIKDDVTLKLLPGVAGG